MESLNKALKFSDKFSNEFKVKYETIISEMDSKRGAISKDVFKKYLIDIYKMVTNQNKNITVNINNAKRHFDSNDSISPNLSQSPNTPLNSSISTINESTVQYNDTQSTSPKVQTKQSEFEKMNVEQKLDFIYTKLNNIEMNNKSAFNKNMSRPKKNIRCHNCIKIGHI
jgi:hypothetical protein